MSFKCLKGGLIESREVQAAVAREEKNHFLVELQWRKDLKMMWHQVAVDYYSRTLTFQKDKLVAIPRIASLVGKYIKDKYFAGLW